MSRVARIVVPGYPHHVTQRGNRHGDVFDSDADREAYLRFLQEYSERHRLAVWAYCLMTNHIHLVVVPEREESLGLALHDAHTAYGMYFNTRTHLSGHIWQGRFHSCPMDESHLWAAVRYVERNPVRAGLVERAEEYQWSSAAAHCGLRQDALLANGFPSAGVIDNWRDWLSGREEGAIVDTIRQKTHTGRPCGSPAFVEHLENLLNRVLSPQKRGRKTKPDK